MPEFTASEQEWLPQAAARSCPPEEPKAGRRLRYKAAIKAQLFSSVDSNGQIRIVKEIS